MRKLIIIAFASAAMLAMTGCDEINSGLIIDWYPVNVYLKVTDGNGTDLLDPENPDNMIDGATITFQGKTYQSSREREDLYKGPETKDYLAQIYGLLLVKDSILMHEDAEGYSLAFGEIDGSEDMDEDLVVTLSDGTTGTIHYHCSDHNEKKISCKRSWKFNGKKHDGNIFTFIISK